MLVSLEEQASLALPYLQYKATPDQRVSLTMCRGGPALAKRLGKFSKAQYNTTRFISKHYKANLENLNERNLIKGYLIPPSDALEVLPPLEKVQNEARGQVQAMRQESVRYNKIISLGTCVKLPTRSYPHHHHSNLAKATVRKHHLWKSLEV